MAMKLWTRHWLSSNPGRTLSHFDYRSVGSLCLQHIKDTSGEGGTGSQLEGSGCHAIRGLNPEVAKVVMENEWFLCDCDSLVITLTCGHSTGAFTPRASCPPSGCELHKCQFNHER